MSGCSWHTCNWAGHHAACMRRCLYGIHNGHRALLHGLKEALWHSISHTLSIDVFRVNSFPSRIITVAYAFLVQVLINTYTGVCRLSTHAKPLSVAVHRLRCRAPLFRKTCSCRPMTSPHLAANRRTLHVPCKIMCGACALELHHEAPEATLSLVFLHSTLSCELPQAHQKQCFVQPTWRHS